jgi:hypothetical protein
VNRKQRGKKKDLGQDTAPKDMSLVLYFFQVYPTSYRFQNLSKQHDKMVSFNT